PRWHLMLVPMDPGGSPDTSSLLATLLHQCAERVLASDSGRTLGRWGAWKGPDRTRTCRGCCPDRDDPVRALQLHALHAGTTTSQRSQTSRATAAPLAHLA